MCVCVCVCGEKVGKGRQNDWRSLPALCIHAYVYVWESGTFNKLGYHNHIALSPGFFTVSHKKWESLGDKVTCDRSPPHR